MATKTFVWICVQDRWRNSPPFAWLDDWEHAREYFRSEVLQAGVESGVFDGPFSRRIWIETRKDDKSTGEQTVMPLPGGADVYIYRGRKTES